MPDPNVDLVAFIAESAADAVAQVRDRLGPQAVVVNVRPLPSTGQGWFRKKRQRFEVLAYRPTASASPPPPPSPARSGALLDQVDSAQTLAPAGVSWDERSATTPTPEGAVPAVATEPGVEPAAGSTEGEIPARTFARAAGSAPNGSWRVAGLLESSGFQPANAQRVADELRRHRGDLPPSSWVEELALAREALMRLWRRPAPLATGPGYPHVLIGGPGAGKTTGLCKWLTQTVLVEGRSARVWRLDGSTANTGEALSVYCEILGVPWERTWRGEESAEPFEVGFIDLPGVEWRDAGRVKELGAQVQGYGAPQIHLVLNGAYDISVLLAQVRAFSVLPIADVVITHLDEETRWGKLWNLVLGTNYSVRFLSAGQNIPGEFLPASPEAIFLRQFPQ